MRLIHSATDPAAVGRRLDDTADLAAAYAYPAVAGHRTWTRATMVSSIDGASRGPDGRSGTLSDPSDQRLLALQRGLADVVLVGAGTARAEGYGPVEQDPEHVAARLDRHQSPAAAMAVVSRRLDLQPSAPLFTEAAETTGSSQRTIVFTVESSPAYRRAALAEVADVIVVGEADIDIAAALGHLADVGLWRVLCEGGPRLLAHVARVRLLDELCLTTAPRLLGGDHPRVVVGAPLDEDPPGGLRWRLMQLIADGSTLFARWQPQPDSTAAMS